jgi:hypothetical protein
MEGLTSNGAGWEIATTTGVIRASRVILATGGLSVPATGSDGLGLTLARTLGHRVHEPYAALTPLTFDADRHPLEPHAALGTRHPALGTPHPAPHPAPRTPHSAPHSAPCTLHPFPASPSPYGSARGATAAPRRRRAASCLRTVATAARRYSTSHTSASAAREARARSCASRGAQPRRRSGRRDCSPGIGVSRRSWRANCRSGSASR